MNNVEQKKIDATLLPTPRGERNWDSYHFFSLWIGMSIGIPTYYLASGLLVGGMNLLQAMMTILLANLILLIPLYLNGHAGEKYGIPSPVYWRAAFGFSGNVVPAILRAIVAGGWFGIQIWVGGSALNVIAVKLFPAWESLSIGIWICFAVFWGMNIFFLVSGANWIKKLEQFSAPFLLIWMVLLVIWAFKKANGFGPLVSAPSAFASFGAFMAFFIPSLNSNIGYWASMPLNITDFTRSSVNDKAYWKGQMYGLPLGMVGLALVGSIVTSATIDIYGKPVWDPVVLTSNMEHPVLVIGMMAFLMLATLTTNVAANGYSPSMDIAHISNGRLTFKKSAVLLGIISILIQPWKLLNDLSLYMNLFLNGCSVFLAPIAGILICQYMILSKRTLNLDALYNEEEKEYNYSELSGIAGKVEAIHFVIAAVLLILGVIGQQSWLSSVTKIGVSIRILMFALSVYLVIVAIFMHLHKKGGVNPLAIGTLSVSVLICYSGLWFQPLVLLYDASYFIGLIISILLYYAAMKKYVRGAGYE